MLGQLNRCIILLFITTISLAGSAQAVVDSLKNRLAETDNLRDSIIILNNLYDNSPRSLQGEVLEELFELALRHGDYHMVNDVLKRSVTHYSANDPMQQVLLAHAQKLPDTPEKQGTITYMNLANTTKVVRALTKDQRVSRLREYLALQTRSKRFDTYKRIQYLYELCTYLSLSTGGELLTNYLKEQQALIDSLPSSDLDLKYLFYSKAANRYLSNGMIPEAVAANKTLLGIIDELEQHNAEMGRAPGKYDEMAFRCYERLLRCRNVLTQDEIEDYYGKILSLIDRNAGVPFFDGRQKKPTINYLMAKKQYADAIPLIKEQLNDTTNKADERLYIVEALIEASDAVGDKEDLLMALETSNDLIKDRLENKASESYKDLQMIYDVNDLKETNDELAFANQQIIINRHKEQLTYIVVCFFVLVVLLVVVFVLYRRSKLLTTKLTKANAMITEEHDALQLTQKNLLDARERVKVANRMKNDFVNNMGHEIKAPLESVVEYSNLIADCVSPEQHKSFKRFADVITLNADHLLTLVNEVLDLPSLENAKVSVHPKKTSVQDICRAAIENVILYVKPEVDLIFDNEDQEDIIAMTDPHRVEQVLMNLMLNASKYTDEGSVTLSYSVSPRRDKLTFIVEDTGMGIPEGKEEEIFGRPDNVDDSMQENCIGLYISRLIAGMLGGSLTVDKDYHAGARFIFTISIS